MKALLAVALTASIAISTNASLAREKTAQCYLQVDGKSYLDQPCNFSMEKDDSFTIGTTSENGSFRMPFFAYVNKNEDGTS